MAVTRETEIVEGVVDEPLEPMLVATVTPDEGSYSIVPRLPIGLLAAWSEETGRLYISGTPTISSSQEHIITGAKSRTGVAVLIVIREEAPTRTFINTKASVTRQAGRNHASFSIATIVGDVFEDDITVSGFQELGLQTDWNGTRERGESTWDIALFGFIKASVPPGSYSIIVQAHDLTAFYTLRVTAATTTVTPDEVAPPYWESFPGIVIITQGKRISPANPLFVGSINQADGLVVQVRANGLPAGITFFRRESDGACFIYGTATQSGSPRATVSYSVPGSDTIEATLRFTVFPAQTEVDPFAGTLNSPPTIVVLQRNVEVGVDVPINTLMFDIDDPDDLPTTTTTGLPPGLSLDRGTGSEYLLSGTVPTTARRGAYRITVTATDGVNQPVSKSATITVTGEVPRINPPAHTNVASDFSLQQNVSGSLKRLLTVTGDTSNEVTGLPPDLRWEKRGNNIVLLGRVQREAPRTAYRVVITSTNLGGQASSEIVITITGTTPSPTEGTRGITIREQSYTFVQGQVVREQIFDATVNITNEDLPEGLRLSARGLLTGTVLAPPRNYVVKLTNTAAAVEQSITITIRRRSDRVAPTLSVFSGRAGRGYSFSAPGEPGVIDVTTARLTGRSVDEGVAITGWEFGQPLPPPPGQSAFTTVLNDRPIWLLEPGSANLHLWRIAPFAVPSSHYNRLISFSLIAKMGELAQQIDVLVYVLGPTPKPLPTIDTTSGTIIAEITLDRRDAPFNLNSGTYQIDREWTLNPEIDAYGIYWRNTSVTSRGLSLIHI